MDVADLIASFSTPGSAGLGQYNVTRTVASMFTNGIASPGSTSTFVVTGSVQPASGRDLYRLPELRRSLETRVLYTSTLLQVGQEGGANEADKVEIEGALWEVQQANTWLQGAIDYATYYRCILQRPVTP